MNTPVDPSDNELRHAEYALGVLDADARAAVERETHADPRAAQAVTRWQLHLAPLGEDIAAVQPAAYVWARILSELGLRELPRNAPAAHHNGWWDSLQLWRWIGVGASVVAAAAIVVMVTKPQPTAPPTTSASYMVASIKQDNGIAGWTATMDLQNHRMLVVPAATVAITSSRDAQLWLIPPGGKPISLGVLPRDRPISVALSASLQAQLSARALLAVSVEPTGGSPTGQPTGPVIAKGAISAV